MGTKMKGLLKGFCQISNIFDAKDQEMQIGFPTDVKHVAHIGWDGPPVNSSGWMNDSQSTGSMPLKGATNGGGNELVVSSKLPSQDSKTNRGANTSLPKESPAAKPSKRITSPDVPNADAETTAAPKHSRRRQPHSDCLSRESTEASRRGRRERKSSGSGSGGGSSDSSAVEGDAVPKQPRKKKAAKEPTEGSVRRSSRSKDTVTAASVGAGSEKLPGPPTKPANEGTGGGLQ